MPLCWFCLNALKTRLCCCTALLTAGCNSNADLMSVTVSDNSIQNGLHGIKGFLNHIKGACNAILFQLEVLHIVMMLSFPWYVWMLSLTYYKIKPLNKWLITKDVLFLHEPWQNSKEIWNCWQGKFTHNYI